MKSIIKNNSIRIFLALVLLGMYACTKSDSPYYNYENKVQSFNGSALGYLQAQPQGTFDSLLVVLERFPDLKDSLTTEQVTLFAPVNRNFETAIKYLNIRRKLEGKDALFLNDLDIDGLEEIVCKYIIRGNRTTDAYVNSSDGVIAQSILFDYPMHIKYSKESSSGYIGGGASTLNFSNPFGSVFTQDWGKTKATTVNIKTNNATINILETIHNFGFKEFTERLNN